MHVNEPRIPPLSDAELTDEQREQVGRLWPDGRVFNIFRTLVHHPKLLKRWTVFGNHVLFKSTLPARDRELVILRIGWLCHSDYEWAQHWEIGRTAGLSEDEMRRVADGPDAPGWDPFDAALLRAADELHADARMGDETWKRLSERYDAQQLIDVVFAVGQYALVSMALNTLGVPLDKGLKGFEQTVGRKP